jgi:hypothetical protein
MSTRESASKWETAGFYGAPVTKALCIIVIGAHLAISNTNTIPDNLISLPLSVWKLFLGTLTFANFGEVVWSLPVLYAFRGIERRMGSRKFASFCILCSTFVLFTQVGLLHIFSFTKVASGPYAVIFGLFVFYFAMIPKLSPNSLSLFGIEFSDKTMTYFMGLQLALNTWSNSFASAAAGAAFGLLYTAEVLPLHRFRIPSSITAMLGKMFLPWLGSASPWETRIRREQQRQQQQRQQIAQRANNMTPQQMAELAQRDPAAAAQLLQQAQMMAAQHQQNRMQQRTQNAAPQGAAGAAGAAGVAGQFPVVEPTEENVAQITAMGFSADRAREALLATQNNVEAAVGRLISS